MQGTIGRVRPDLGRPELLELFVCSRPRGIGRHIPGSIGIAREHNKITSIVLRRARELCGFDVRILQGFQPGVVIGDGLGITDVAPDSGLVGNAVVMDLDRPFGANDKIATIAARSLVAAFRLMTRTGEVGVKGGVEPPFVEGGVDGTISDGGRVGVYLLNTNIRLDARSVNSSIAKQRRLDAEDALHFLLSRLARLNDTLIKNKVSAILIASNRLSLGSSFPKLPALLTGIAGALTPPVDCLAPTGAFTPAGHSRVIMRCLGYLRKRARES